MRVGLAVLVVANFVLAGTGLLLPFAAAESDSSAPWAGEVFRFNLASWGAASFLMLSAYVFGAFMHARGRSGVLAAASIGSLVLPAATSAAYLWYLRNVAEGTIGGAVGFQLVLLSAGLAVLALLEAVLLVFLRAMWPARHLRAA
jgi:hypothetical protein